MISVHSLPSAQDSDGIVVPTIPTDGIVVPTIPSDGDTSTSGADVPQDSGDPRDRGDQRTADGANTSERGQRVSAEPNSGEDTRTNRLKAVEFSQSGARRGDSDQGSPAPTVDNSKLGLACEVYGVCASAISQHYLVCSNPRLATRPLQTNHGLFDDVWRG